MSTTNKMPGDVSLDIEKMAAASQKSMMAFAHLHHRLLRNSLRMNAELLDFARKRVAEDIRASDRLARCDDVTEALDVVTGFYNKAFEEYAEEANQLMRLGSDVARESLEEIQTEARSMSGVAPAK